MATVIVITTTSSVLELAKNDFGWFNGTLYSKDNPFGKKEVLFTRLEEVEGLLTQCKLEYYTL